MHLIKPTRIGVINPLTGDEFPAEGVTTDFLIPAFHALERTGAVTFDTAPEKTAKPAKKDSNAD